MTANPAKFFRIARLPVGFAVAAVAACLVLTPWAMAAPAKSKAPKVRSSESDPVTRAAFEARVKDYMGLHRKVEATLPKLSVEATPQEIDKNQRALGALLLSARPNAKQGEFFTPAMQRYLARLFDQLFSGTNGKNLLGSIMDENPGAPTLAVNERYPDDVPLSTMPPELLSALPTLEEDMEYRFVGRRLVLLDAHGHIVVDFTDELLPA